MMEFIARSLATAALMLAAQVALGQTMYRVVPIHDGEPLSVDTQGRILLRDGDAAYHVCSKSNCRALSDRHPPTHWMNFNDQGALTGYSGESALRKDAQHGGGAHVITHGYGFAIAPDGSVVGFDDKARAFLFTDRRIALEGLAGLGAAAYDINSRHVIVGRSWLGDEKYSATMWVDAGPPQDLGIPHGHLGSSALAINESNVAVGYSFSPLIHSPLPVRFADGKVQVFQLPSARVWGLAMDINAAGTIVGYLGTAQSTSAAIVEGDRMVDLNTRLRPADAAVYQLGKAVAVNDAGQIAAMHFDPLTGTRLVVLLEPIP